MSMNYSAYQIAIFDFIKNENGSCIVDAKAGSGKTTSIVKACSFIPNGASVLFLAFNRSIVAELNNRLPKHVVCKTFNGCGWNAWVRHTGKSYRQMKVDGKKTWTVIRSILDERDRNLYGAFINKMIGLAKSSGIRPDADISEWLEIMDHHSVQLSSADASEHYGLQLANKVLKESINISNYLCDFDDQIYMPWLCNSSFQKYDYVFIDEAQDTSVIQVELLRRMLKPNGRLIAVGDPGQAIYGFRGADSESMNNIKNAFDAKILPLSISYRCAKSIIKSAQAYVPDIQASDNASEGEVVNLNDYNVNTFTAKDAILCRNNAPLVEMAYQFISRGKAINFPGRDIGAGLKSLIKRMEAKDLDDLSMKLNDWLEKEIAKLAKKNQEEKIEVVSDKVRCIEIFIDNLPNSRRTVIALIGAIDDLFSSKNDAITLSSVHKSKGSEWDRVFILDFHLMPSKYAKKEWAKIQEKNLIYVAITRAKNYLGFINSDCWKDDSGLNIQSAIDSKRSVARSKPKSPKTSYGSFNPFAK